MKRQVYNEINYARFFQQGNEEGLKYFYVKLHPALSLYANRWVNDRSIAEDIASEAFIRTWKFHAKFESYAAIKAYIYKASRRLSQRYAGKEYKRSKVHKEVFSLISHDETAFDNLVRAETYTVLHASIAKLPRSLRKVISMHFLEGKKVIDIAEELELAPCTISVQKGLGLKALRKIMTPPLLVLLSLQIFFAPL